MATVAGRFTQARPWRSSQPRFCKILTRVWPGSRPAAAPSQRQLKLTLVAVVAAPAPRRNAASPRYGAAQGRRRRDPASLVRCSRMRGKFASRKEFRASGLRFFDSQLLHQFSSVIVSEFRQRHHERHQATAWSSWGSRLASAGSAVAVKWRACPSDTGRQALTEQQCPVRQSDSGGALPTGATGGFRPRAIAVRSTWRSAALFRSAMNGPAVTHRHGSARERSRSGVGTRARWCRRVAIALAGVPGGPDRNVGRAGEARG
jgi:hypothetical protein